MQPTQYARQPNSYRTASSYPSLPVSPQKLVGSETVSWSKWNRVLRDGDPWFSGLEALLAAPRTEAGWACVSLVVGAVPVLAVLIIPPQGSSPFGSMPGGLGRCPPSVALPRMPVFFGRV